MAARRNTQQKGIIRETLCCMHNHPTAGQVYEEVRRNHPTISRSTVFRVLSQMAEEGLALRVCLTGSDDRFDGNTCRHSHIRCRRCGAVADIPWVTMGTPEDTAGYQITDCRVEYEGLCPDCRKAAEADAAAALGGSLAKSINV